MILLQEQDPADPFAPLLILILLIDLLSLPWSFIFLVLIWIPSPVPWSWSSPWCLHQDISPIAYLLQSRLCCLYSEPYESVCAEFFAFFYVDLSPSEVSNPFFNGVSLFFLAMLLVDPPRHHSVFGLIIIFKFHVLTVSKCLNISLLSSLQRCYLTNGFF